MNVKVGQVYRTNFSGHYEAIVITHLHQEPDDDIPWACDYIYNDGIVVTQDDCDFFDNTDRQLIAEYPTWTEAVCSQYFNNPEEYIGEL